MQLQGVNVNDNEGLEKEVDVMEGKAIVQRFVPTQNQLNQWQITPAIHFDQTDVLFASVDGGNVGSIYFTNGRIRLTHEDGPAIEPYPGQIARYAITNPVTAQEVLEGKSAYDQWLNKADRTFAERVIFLNGMQGVVPAPAKGTLFEIFDNGQDHISRGTPQVVNFGFDAQLQIM